MSSEDNADEPHPYAPNESEQSWTGEVVPSLQNIQKNALASKEDSVRSVALTSDFKKIWCGYKSGVIKIYEATNLLAKSTPHTVPGHSKAVNCLIVVGGNVWSASADGSIAIWSTETLECVKKLTGHRDFVNCLVHFQLEQNHFVCSSSNDSTVRIWDCQSLETVGILKGHRNWIRCISYISSTTRLWSASDDSSIKVWDVSQPANKQLTGKPKTISVPCGVFSLLQVEETVWTGCADKSIRVFDMNGVAVKTIGGAHIGGIQCMALIGDYIWSGSMDRTIKIWDKESVKPIQRFSQHKGSVLFITPFKNGKVITGATDDAVLLWVTSDPSQNEESGTPEPKSPLSADLNGSEQLDDQESLSPSKSPTKSVSPKSANMMHKSGLSIEISHKKKQLTKLKSAFKENELAQLTTSIRMEASLSKLENRTKGLSSTLEEQADTIQILTKENQRLRTELHKYLHNDIELQKTVSKESSQISKLELERDELRKELKEVKINLRDEIVHASQMQAEFEQVRKQADMQEKRLFIELSVMQKQIEEERQGKEALENEKRMLIVNYDELQERNARVEREYKRLDTFFKLVRREIKAKGVTAETYERLEEKMLFNSSLLDDADKEIERLTIDLQTVKTALEEETVTRLRLLDERKKMIAEQNKAKHELEKEIIDLKKQLFEMKKGRMEVDRLLLQAQAKIGELQEDLDSHKMLSSTGSTDSLGRRKSPQQRRRRVIAFFEVQAQTDMTCTQMDTDAETQQQYIHALLSKMERKRQKIKSLKEEIKLNEEYKAKFEAESKARQAIKNGMDSMKLAMDKQYAELEGERQFAELLHQELERGTSLLKETEQKYKDQLAELEAALVGAKKAQDILETALEKAKKRVETLEAQIAEGEARAESRESLKSQRSPRTHYKSQRKVTRAILTIELERMRAERDQLDKDCIFLKRKLDREREERQELESQLHRVREEYEVDMEKLQLQLAVPENEVKHRLKQFQALYQEELVNKRETEERLLQYQEELEKIKKAAQQAPKADYHAEEEPIPSPAPKPTTKGKLVRRVQFRVDSAEQPTEEPEQPEAAPTEEHKETRRVRFAEEPQVQEQQPEPEDDDGEELIEADEEEDSHQQLKKELEPTKIQEITEVTEKQPAVQENGSTATAEEPKEAPSPTNTSEKRKQVALELINTEKTYVESLETLKKMFLDPLLSVADSPAKMVLSRETIRKIFSDVLEVIISYNHQLYDRLKQRTDAWSEEQQIGDVFLELMDYFKVYTNYVNNYDSALNELSKASKNTPFKKFLTIWNYRPQDIEMLLILPIQRIPRYILLLQEIAKYTPEVHADYQHVLEALSKMKSIATFINDTKRERDSYHEIVEVQSKLDGRERNLVEDVQEYKGEEDATEVKHEGIVPRHLFFFKNMIVVSKLKKTLFTKDSNAFYKYLYELPLHANTTIANVPDSEDITNAFSVSVDGKLYTFCLKAPENKSHWIKELNSFASRNA